MKPIALVLIAAIFVSGPANATASDEITVTADGGRTLQMTAPPSAIHITYPLAGNQRSITIAITQDGQHSELANNTSLYRFDRFRQRDIKQFSITITNGRRERTVRVPRAWRGALRDALGPAYDVDKADTTKQFVVDLDTSSGNANYSITTTQGCD